MSEENSQRANRLIRWLVIVGIALTAAALFPVLNRDANYIARLQRRVVAELPAGTTESFVDKWLRSNNKFEPTWHVPPQVDAVGGRDVIELAGVPREQVASLLRATVPRQDIISEFRPDYVRVYFFFDKRRKLIGSHFLRWSDIVRMEGGGSIQTYPSSPRVN